MSRVSKSSALVGGGGVEDVEGLVDTARKLVNRRLELRDHTNSELLEHLMSRGIPVEIATPLLDRCQVLGLVDDARFAKTWVECRGGSGKRSGRALRAELRAKGIAHEIIQEAMAEYSPEAELDSARMFALRKYRSAAGRDRSHLVRVVIAALGRRGYPPSTCGQVAKETADRLLVGDR